MRKLEDLKSAILDNKLDKFYVFYGEDYGIRKHYIQKLSTFFNNKCKYVNDYTSIKALGKTRSLFGDDKQLVVVYNDFEFSKLPEHEIKNFIDGLRDCTCVFVYEIALENSSLFKHFENYITYFPVVQDNIAQEFVDSTLKLDNATVQDLAYNCNNQYNNILLESDKIKEYGIAKDLSDQSAYEALSLKNQLLERIDDFNASEFMNDILTQHIANYAYWYIVIKNNVDKFFGSLLFIFNDYLIAALIKKYGAYGANNGSSEAYKYKLSWGRTKVIRTLDIPYNSEYLFNRAYKVACIDTDVKSGRVERDKIIDYFFSEII